MLAISLVAGGNQSDGIAYNAPEAPVKLTRVYSYWTSDFDPSSRMQGPIYFNDCAEIKNLSSRVITHMQIVFASVDKLGSVKPPTFPLDIKYRLEPGSVHNELVNCRDHAFANGDRGLWLAAWIQTVDFADGSRWTAPATVPLHSFDPENGGTFVAARPADELTLYGQYEQ
ncbi:MAG TPA: hypothetical protein VFL13_01540 [Candidatus Baltobacteraceae bacterium]|nr:hypothetical protein [Candidatus Baltobacteraceae bacterium]